MYTFSVRNTLYKKTIKYVKCIKYENTHYHHTQTRVRVAVKNYIYFYHL